MHADFQSWCHLINSAFKLFSFDFYSQLQFTFFFMNFLSLIPKIFDIEDTEKLVKNQSQSSKFAVLTYVMYVMC